ncbi:hypothetical protein [Roseimicrobium sp. ORNL1]|uniref:hypothetical protein n=1 Tax=Roseimicrobium sp. ORNL1 TaxID=2711231 RepID=UPI0013E0F52D|nr:hypothetical protein [Roseimicrobium sp. ORNL1]QIF01949.1 hypothetical protein G5S37_10550 [Roseimicrobium sp. ORNL1]
MSRRTKVILLLVSLALVSLTAVNLGLVWAPENPLRFRIIAPPPEKLERAFHDGTAHVSGYQVEVENTTGATIRLLRAELFGPEESDGSRVQFSNVQTASAAAEQDLVIPPHGSRRLELSMFEATYVAELARSEMTCTFLSRSKENYMNLLDYVDRKWPSLSLSMRFYPLLDGNSVPVQMSEQ